MMILAELGDLRGIFGILLNRVKFAITNSRYDSEIEP